jgi:hypothetical protein
MDYTPDKTARLPGIDFTHGIIKRIHGGHPTTTGQAIVRRLSLHGRGEIDCFDHEVLLPRHAPDVLRKLHQLVLAYEEQLLPEQQDLLGIATLRFELGECFHHQWELARVWVRESLNARDLAAVMVHHVPALAGRPNKPHIHVLYPVRALHGTFGAFVKITGAALAAEWRAHLAAEVVA